MSGSRTDRARRRAGVAAVAVAVVATALAAGACRPIHRDTNAPGHVDVLTAPRVEPGRVEQPRDPGERMDVISPGIYGGVGGQLGRPEGDRSFGFIGLELTVNRGSSPRSHYEDSFFVYPVAGNGASVGWTLVQIVTGDERGTSAELGPIYAEVHSFRLFAFGAGLGYAVDPNGSVPAGGGIDHGPQVSAWIGPYLFRARYLFAGGGLGLSFAGQLKVPTVWTWSQ